MPEVVVDPFDKVDLSLEDFPRPTKEYHTQTYDRIALRNTDFDGKGKTLFITGGATGIGKSISNAFANAGVARIAMMSRSPGPLAKTKSELEAAHPGLQVLTFGVSLTDHARVAAVLAEVGHIDVLVHSATAAGGMTLPPAQVPVAEMQEVYDTNVIGAFNLLRSYVEASGSSGGGSGGGRSKTFINISSASVQFRVPGQAAYGSTKAAFAQLVEHFATQENMDAATKGKERVRMFNLHPGAFYTDLAATVVKPDALKWDDIRLPADYCVWLAGPQSDFLHGRFLWPHWDLGQLIEQKERVEKDPTWLTVTVAQ